MDRIANNLTHLEPGMWFTLLSLIGALYIFLAIVYVSQKRTQHVVQEELNSSTSTTEHSLELFQEYTPTFTSNEVETQMEQPDRSKRKKRNSVSAELYYKSLGLMIIGIAAIIRYVFNLHPEKVHYAVMWQVHATMALIIFGAWVYGASRKKPRGIWDIIVNVLLVIWAVVLFN